MPTHHSALKPSIIYNQQPNTKKRATTDEFLAKGSHSSLTKKLTFEKLSIGADNMADIAEKAGFDKALDWWSWALDDPESLVFISIRLDALKTDRLRVEAVVHVAAVTAGAGDSLIYRMCPVRALLRHWRVRRKKG